MPKIDSNSTLSRQWEILKLIPKRGVGLSASQITQKLHDSGFNISKRTVERDLQELSRIFALHCNERSKPYGWRWQDGASVYLPSLSVPDAVSLKMVEKLVRPLLPTAILASLESRFELAAQKLEHLSGANALAGWNEKIVLKSPSQPLLPPRINQAVLEIVQDSLLHDKQICARYRAAGSNESNEVVLHPLGLVQRDAATYLVATAFHYRDIRLYALHRIRRAECLEATANRPERFSLEDYVDQGAMGFGVGESVELKGKIHKDFAFYLRETPLSEDMKMLGDGEWLDFSATVRDTWQLKWWLRSYAESIVIQEPKRFRDDIVADLKSTLNHYESV